MIHIPVLSNEIVAAFEPFYARTETVYVDGTFGRGGHFRLLLEKNPGMQAIAFDQDPDAYAFAQAHFGELLKEKRLLFYLDNFVNFEQHYDGPIDFALLDLGVSSPQLDEPSRGFSFYHDGPLDMRMNNQTGITAADLVNQMSENDLVVLFKTFGEISNPFRVVRAILEDRKETPFTSTKQLSGLIERVDGWRRKGFHPATQYFMALRLKVNRELEVVDEVLPKLMAKLRPGGRLAVITFHSLEDRIVKNLFRIYPELGEPLRRKVTHPTREEELANPRSRSGKLRVFVRA
ncbi:MAG: 16S rRNA (cytosine(1402)-N(4))-methyltransferase RsmH [Bdellovibrionaceae bacterium]|nr:16S rRNA (cytosine(1402)-N(4))-methyltransferase RsmH [Pseudobdellovibrionaceae bacterium]